MKRSSTTIFTLITLLFSVQSYADEFVYERKHQPYDFHRSYECKTDDVLLLGSIYGNSHKEGIGDKINVLFTAYNQVVLEIYQTTIVGDSVDLMFFDIITDNEKLLWIEPPQHLVTPEMPSLYMKLYKDRTKYNFIWFVKNKDVDQLIALTCK